MSKIFKSKDLEHQEYSNYEYEDCTPEGYEIPTDLFPSFEEKIAKNSDTAGDQAFESELTQQDKQDDAERKETQDMKLKAEVYLQQAKDRSEEKFQESYQKGFKQGSEEGFKAGEEKQKVILESYSKELANLAKLREDLMKQSEKSIINLVLKISKKILQTELSLNPELIRAIVKAGIQRAISPGKMKLRINPEDAKFVQENLNKIVGSTEIAKNILIERDETIVRGSCIVTNNYGDVDARIDEQLKEIEKECMKFLD